MKTRVYVAGHSGMVGSAIVRQLKVDKSIDLLIATRDELDLRNQADVQAFFHSQRIDQVYVASAKVGGIHANSTYPADFLYDNMMIQSNIIHSAYTSGESVNLTVYLRLLGFRGNRLIDPQIRS